MTGSAPTQAVCEAAGTVPGAATMMSPASGSRAPPSASALTCAFTVPTLVPGAADVSSVVPFGMMIAARAVASSAASETATIRVTPPGAYETESAAVPYAAVAVAAIANAMSAASEITASRAFFMPPSWLRTG